MKPRPDGRNELDYEGLRTASLLRFAWEFLRRDQDFKADCVNVRADRLDQDEAATKWGLRQFKDYREAFAHGEKPQFLPTRAVFYSGKPDGNRRLKIILSPGKVAVVFDLGHASRYRQALDVQIKKAARGLVQRALALIEANAAKPKNIKKPRSKEELITYLRLLDLDNVNASTAEVRQILYSHKRNSRGEQSADKTVYNHRDIAQEYAGGGYIRLALSHFARQPLASLDPRRKK